MALFGFGSTPLTEALEKALHEEHDSNDLALHLHICDLVNDSENGPKDAVRILKRRLASRSVNAIHRALIVLETCSKNCGRRFHLALATHDFLDPLASMATSFNKTLPGMLREKVLELIQSWADAFRGQRELAAVEEVYQGLRRAGVEFPDQNLDTMAPMYTPEAVQSPGGAAGGASASGGGPQHSVSQVQADEEYARELQREFSREAESSQSQAAGPSESGRGGGRRRADADDGPARFYRIQYISAGHRVMATEGQVAKLRKDLEVVNGNVTLLNDILSGLTDADRIQDNELAQDLATTCGAMQVRVMDLVEVLNNEEFVVELLQINDQLNLTLANYKQRMEVDAQKQAQAPAPAVTPGRTGEHMHNPMYAVASDDGALPVAEPVGAEGMRPMAAVGGVTTTASGTDGGGEDEDEHEPFDMFAQTRQSTFRDSMRTGSGYVTSSDDLFGGDKPPSSLVGSVYPGAASAYGAGGPAPAPAGASLLDAPEPDHMLTSTLAPSSRPPTSSAADDLADIFGSVSMSGGASASSAGGPMSAPLEPVRVGSAATSTGRGSGMPVNPVNSRRQMQMEQTEDDLFGL